MMKLLKYNIFIMFISIMLVSGIFAVSENYMIGPGDTLEIHAWNKDNPDLLIVNPVATTSTKTGTIVTTMSQDTHSVTVSRDGRIYIPLIGVIKVDNMTTRELEEFLKKELRRFISDAQVTVLIKQPKPLKIYVMGQVLRPGMYSVPDGNPQEARVINFINMAGGLNNYAQADQIKVVRKESGQEKTFIINFYKIEKEGDVSQNMILLEGDTVIVPQRFNQVYVLGYVVRPGALPYIEGAKVADYIGSAGGLTRFAASDNIGIIRGDPKSPQVIKIKLNRYMTWQSDSENPNIMPGDVIYIPQSWFADWADMAGIIIGFRDTRNAVRDLASPSEWEVK